LETTRVTGDILNGFLISNSAVQLTHQLDDPAGAGDILQRLNDLHSREQGFRLNSSGLISTKIVVEKSVTAAFVVST